MKVGLMTGGGDCPGLNAVIRAVVENLAAEECECIGLLEGWRGLIQRNVRPLEPSDTEGIIGLGGTILGSSRTNPYKHPETDLARLRAHFKELSLDALIVVGGDDTLGVAYRLFNDFGLPIVGIPKTIDNDLLATDFSFGFDTAVNVVTEAVDRLRTTAESHRRVVVVETMGRHSGWLACFAGIAVGADFILIPEVPIDVPHMTEMLRRRRGEGKQYGIVLVAEGARFPEQDLSYLGEAVDPFMVTRFGGIAHDVGRVIETQLGIETRCVVLGHLQRGGPPSAHDRILATRLGLAASRAVLQQRFGTIVRLSEGRISEAALDENVTAIKTLDLSYYDEAAAFFRRPLPRRTGPVSTSTLE
jgi:6-phosphofructokinase 1